MNMSFSHILVILQHSSLDDLVLKRAIEFAKNNHCTLTIFSPLDKQQPLSYENSHLHHTEQRLLLQREQLADTARSLGANGLKINIIVSADQTVKTAIAHLLTLTDINLIISAHQMKKSMRELFSGNLESFLISECELPVWLVKADTDERERKILACIDVDDDSAINTGLNRSILAISKQLSPQLASQLHIINCYDGSPLSMSLPYNADTGFEHDNHDLLHSEKMLSYLSSSQIDKDAIHVSAGLPDDEIPKTVQDLKACLTIIGNSHMHGFIARIFGDTAHYLTSVIPSDILVVKPNNVRR